MRMVDDTTRALIRAPRPGTRCAPRGMRWTPQRRALLDVLSQTDGHVTGTELVERCRAARPGDDPLDGLSDARRARGARLRAPRPRPRRARGVPRPARGASTATSSASRAGATWEIDTTRRREIVRALERRRGFRGRPVAPGHRRALPELPGRFLGLTRQRRLELPGQPGASPPQPASWPPSMTRHAPWMNEASSEARKA